jgi:hypothetical protein
MFESQDLDDAYERYSPDPPATMPPKKTSSQPSSTYGAGPYLSCSNAIKEYSNRGFRASAVITFTHQKYTTLQRVVEVSSVENSTLDQLLYHDLKEYSREETLKGFLSDIADLDVKQNIDARKAEEERRRERARLYLGEDDSPPSASAVTPERSPQPSAQTAQAVTLPPPPAASPPPALDPVLYQQFLAFQQFTEQQRLAAAAAGIVIDALRLLCARAPVSHNNKSVSSKVVVQFVVFMVLFLGAHSLFYVSEHVYHAQCVSGFISSMFTHASVPCEVLRYAANESHKTAASMSVAAVSTLTLRWFTPRSQVALQPQDLVPPLVLSRLHPSLPRQASSLLQWGG